MKAWWLDTPLSGDEGGGKMVMCGHNIWPRRDGSVEGGDLPYSSFRGSVAGGYILLCRAELRCY